MVVPVDKTIVVQVTGADVIHSWTVPAFGVKQDAVPGRLAELWFRSIRKVSISASAPNCAARITRSCPSP